MRIFLIICICIFSQNSNAVVMLKNYESLKKNKEAHNAYLYGLGDAYQEVNSYNKSKKIKELFCPPDNLALDPDNYTTFIDSYIKKEYDPQAIAKIPQENKEKYKKLIDEKFNIEMVDSILLRELQKAFPCK
jgi:hypothetical protein